MARLNLCGFETGDLIEAGATSGTVAITSSPVKTGNYALRCNPTGTGTGAYRIGSVAANGAAGGYFSVPVLYFKFEFRPQQKPAANTEELAVVRDDTGAVKFFLRIDAGGYLSCYTATATLIQADNTTPLDAASFYRIEGKVGTGLGAAYEVRVNGTAILSGTANLLSTNNGGITLGKVNNRSSNAVDFIYDDVTLEDADYPGETRIEAMQPNANGDNTEWTLNGNPSAPASTYECVDELPHTGDSANPSDWISTSTVNALALVNLESCSAAGISGTVKAAKGLAICRDEATSSGVILAGKSGSTTSSTSSRDPGSSYSASQKLWTTDPNTGAAWTINGLDAFQIGVTNNNAVVMRCTALALMVEFAPAGGTGPRVANHLRQMEIL